MKIPSKVRITSYCALFVALLIASQAVLAFIPNVEVVSVLLAVWCYVFGVWYGTLTATAFSLLRCLIFGFFPSVVALYLIYYNVFAVAFGILGRKSKGKLTLLGFIAVMIVSTLMPFLFTLLDDVITPIFHSFDIDAAKAYALSSIPFAVSMSVTNLLASIGLFYPLEKLIRIILSGKEKRQDT